MKGSRKLIVVLLYLVFTTVVALAVIKFHYDSLVGVSAWAAATGTAVASFIYGNLKEHQAAQQKSEPSSKS